LATNICHLCQKTKVCEAPLKLHYPVFSFQRANSAFALS